MTKTKIQVRNRVLTAITAGCVVGALAAASNGAAAQQAYPTEPVRVVNLNDSKTPGSGDRRAVRNLTDEERQARRGNRSGRGGNRGGDDAGNDTGAGTPPQNGDGDRANRGGNRGNGPVARNPHRDGRDRGDFRRGIARDFFNQGHPRRGDNTYGRHLGRNDIFRGMTPRQRALAAQRLRHMSPQQRQHWYRQMARQQRFDNRPHRRFEHDGRNQRHNAWDRRGPQQRQAFKQGHRPNQRFDRHGPQTRHMFRAPSFHTKKQVVRQNVRLNRQNDRLHRQNNRLERQNNRLQRQNDRLRRNR
jgi:hypothetical protein